MVDSMKIASEKAKIDEKPKEARANHVLEFCRDLETETLVDEAKKALKDQYKTMPDQYQMLSQIRANFEDFNLKNDRTIMTLGSQSILEIETGKIPPDSVKFDLPESVLDIMEFADPENGFSLNNGDFEDFHWVDQL